MFVLPGLTTEGVLNRTVQVGPSAAPHKWGPWRGDLCVWPPETTQQSWEREQSKNGASMSFKIMFKNVTHQYQRQRVEHPHSSFRFHLCVAKHDGGLDPVCQFCSLEIAKIEFNPSKLGCIVFQKVFLRRLILR